MTLAVMSNRAKYLLQRFLSVGYATETEKKERFGDFFLDRFTEVIHPAQV